MKIVVIVPEGRRDFYSYLEQDTANDYVLLWHESKELAAAEAIPPNPFFKQRLFWNQWLTPQAFIDDVRPDKIVFFEIIDQRQIALIVAARRNGISTFYLEHGAAGNRESSLERAEIDGFVRDIRLPYLLETARHSLGPALMRKLSYYSNVKGFSDTRSLLNYWLLPFTMLRYSPNKALRQRVFRERVPDHAIVFSRANLEEFQTYTAIRDDEALLTGVPFFDKYFTSTPTESDHIVYIEHPYLESGLLEWTAEHHRTVAQKLSKLANETKRKVYVKLHPISDRKLWAHVDAADSYLQILQEGDFTNLYLSSRLVLAYSSSLVTGLLCSKKNIVMLGWHPEPRVFGNDFSRTGLCHVSMSSDDIFTQVPKWERTNLCKADSAAYERFLLTHNSPFDGKAGQRVIRAIQTL